MRADPPFRVLDRIEQRMLTNIQRPEPVFEEPFPDKLLLMLGGKPHQDSDERAGSVEQQASLPIRPVRIHVDELARKAGKRRVQFFTKLQAWNSLRKFFHEEKAPAGLTFNKFLQTLQGMTDKRYGRGKSEAGGFTYRARTSRAYIRHQNQTQDHEYELNEPVPVMPGDRILIKERYF